jgi:3'-5' exoribonuclease
MTRRFVEQLADGENVDEIYLVVDKQLRANRNGNTYIQLDLGDRTGNINARMWNAGEPLYKSFEAGDFLQVKGKVQLFQGSLQLIANTLDKYDSSRVELTDFLPHTKHDVSKLLDRLKTTIRKVSDPHLRALAETYFIDDDFMRAFARCPAGVKVHHAYVGGLLEHVVTMLDLAEKVLPIYPDVNRDLVIMGVFLHDSGKVRELSFDRSFAYSDEGQLLGHLTIGIEMLADKARKVPDLTGEPFPAELLLRLKHLILSHHGETEFGSPKVPMTPEAVALHAIDLLDSRLTIALREIADDRGHSAWTPYNSAMGRRLYKGGRNPSAADEPE